MRLRLPPWILLCNVGASDGIHGSSSSSEPDLMVGLAANFPTPAQAALDPRQRNDDPTPHLSYLRNLQNKQPAQSQLEKFGSGYQDYLQAPLQPLTVNLESVTYEVFEKDPIKYDWYEKAIARALHDWIEQGKPTSSPDGRVVVAVVGAGRGPLVTRALRASDDVGVEIDMWALEKNPNAFVLLQHHNANPGTWANRVKLVKSDMRTWRGPWRLKKMTHPGTSGQHPSSPNSTDQVTQEIAPGTVEAEHYTIDILISELLGSFADNELSPECLDGVQHLLNPVHGISIPASYTAHLTPIAAPKLHADVSNQALSNPNAAETPYVVMLHAIDYLSSTTASLPPITPNISTSPSHLPTSSPLTQPTIQKAWSFVHPNHHLSTPQSTTNPTNPTNTANTLHPITATTNSHNTRHATLSFPIPHRGTIHGLAGYFEAVLYGTVELSTNPLTMDQKSEGMISWFPIYFPLKVCNIHRKLRTRRAAPFNPPFPLSFHPLLSPI
jgi:type II protein arginine methyltransferase